MEKNVSMKRILQLVLLLTFLDCFYYNGLAQATDQNKEINLADPTIFFYKGVYYMYGTVEGETGNGFLVYTSTNLHSWKTSRESNGGYALSKGSSFGTSNFWAPQVFVYNNKFYMAYVANEAIAIAEGRSPVGPFVQSAKRPLLAPVKQIDPFVFIDEDGKKYLYHVRLTEGNKLFVAEMTDDFSAIKPETLKECITATEPWENTSNSKWPVTEGPSVLKHDSLYYLFYTANDFRNPDYAVGYAVSKSPYGPWKKYEGNPIISKKNLGMNGTGHGDFVMDKEKNLWYVMHTHNSAAKVTPRKTAIVKIRFTPGDGKGEEKVVADAESFYYPERK